MAAAVPVIAKDDCGMDNSPPCACNRDAESAAFFRSAASASDLPPPLSHAPAPAAQREFAVSRFAASDAPGARPSCAPFAVEISGAAGGPIALNATALRIGGGSGGPSSIDVFAHLYSVRDSARELAVLRAAFGSSLRAVTFERWGTEIEEHIVAVASGNASALPASASAARPPAVEWLGAQLGERFSRRQCGADRANMSPELRCRRPWRTVLSHVLSMWRKVYLASELRRARERAGDCRYQVVVRTRADARPSRVLDLRRFVEPTRAAPSTAHALCAGMGRRYCKQRAHAWPRTACWADDQFAVGGALAMDAYARFFPDFHRFAWWYPLARADGWRHVSERLLGVHFDWRRRAAQASEGAREPFDWHVQQPDGRADFGWALDREVCYRCMSDRKVPQTGPLRAG